MPLSFSQKILNWYHKQSRSLPWRETQDPYKIWISEVMLQQTTVAAVIPYYQRWIERFPTIEDVASADLDEVMKMWQGLGYYRRVKNIHVAAQVVVRDFAGQLPCDKKTLASLPGFGPYTVGAVLSIAFDQREPIIDANVRRLVMRLCAKEGMADTKQDKEIESFLLKVMPHRDMKYFNQALMEMGALVCRAREPICLLCPVKGDCKAYDRGIQELIPTPKKKVIQKVDAAIAVIRNQQKRFYIQKRPDEGLLAGLWEFPGGKQEPDEAIEDTLHREVYEELGVALSSAQFFTKVKHNYTQFSVTLHVFSCTVDEDLSESERGCWVSLEDIQNYAMPSGSARIVDKLLEVAI